MRISIDEMLYGITPAGPRLNSNPDPLRVHVAESKPIVIHNHLGSACGGEFEGGSCADAHSEPLASAGDRCGAVAFISFSAILSLIIWLAMILSACGQSNAAVQWIDEQDVTGYCIYANGLPVFTVARTNYFPLARLSMPPSVYALSLTAISETSESLPAGPLIWTNAAIVTVRLQTSSNLLDWFTIDDSARQIGATNPSTFYRATLSIQ